VYGIVKQMGGAVQVTSAPAQGTTFRLYFPETRAREAAPALPMAASAPRGNETLLLVEDEPAVRAYLTELLERNGYRVLAAENQSTAMASAEAYLDHIHLILTDVVMPGGTGPEMVRALRDLLPGVPALYISGYADGVLARQGAFAKASHGQSLSPEALRGQRAPHADSTNPGPALRPHWAALASPKRGARMRACLAEARSAEAGAV